MATSNSINFTMNRDELVTDAMILIGAIDSPTEGLDPNDLTIAVRFLNKMIKAWEGQGIHLFTKTEATVFLGYAAGSYSLSATGDHASNSYITTTSGAAKAANATTVTLTSSTGMTTGDYIGLVLDDGTLSWTTISTIPGATSVTIPANSIGAAASGNKVFSYTTRLNKPLRVYSARLKYYGANEIPMLKLAYKDYFNLADKASVGTPTQIMYNPNLATGTLKVWPTPSDVTQVVNITYQRQIEDFDTSVDNPDFPTEWLEALTYQLAVRLASRYGQLGKVEFVQLKQLADEYLNNMLSWDNEDVSLVFTADMERSGLDS